MTNTSSASEHRLPYDVVPLRYRIELVPDLAAATFTGTSTVDVEVATPTADIVCNAAELDVTAVTLVSAGAGGAGGATGAGDGATTAKVALDPDRARLTATFDQVLPVGEHTLRYEFSGILNDRLHGFYRSTYVGEDGAERTIATTQFEPTDARLAFPCWDEPDRKATFEITLVVEDGLTVVSNYPEVASDELGDGRRRVRFAETMKMSTYLVAFIVGEFELSEARDVRGVPVRIVAPPGRLHLAPFASEAAEHSLTFLADYFELPYPADKIDHVAIPDFAAGAMENLGCVTYRESALLLDDADASQLERLRVAEVVAHETAHMWFGDLVTMKWWNGIWLNEAFATFMELVANHAWKPEWEVWTGFGEGRAAAMAIDALSTTRPVEFPVGDPVEAEAMFDLLTYQKGGSVLRMLEQYLQPEVFRTGIARYLAEHSHANTETSDLWDALEAASGEPVRSIMESWIFQGGHPVVEVSAGGAGLRLSQHRFSYDGSDGDERWSIPLTVRVSTGGRESVVRQLLDGPSTEVAVDGPIDWVVVNDGGSGFYRVAYSPELLDSLLRNGLSGTSALERMGLLDDTWSAVVAGRSDLAGWARLVEHLGEELDPDVWSAALGPLRLLQLTADDDDMAVLSEWVRRVVGPAFARLGWDAAPGEPERHAITRARLVSALGIAGADPDIRAQAASRLAADRAGEGSLAADLRTAVTHVSVAGGGDAAWQATRQAYLDGSNPQERERNLYALPSSSETELLIATLDYSISSEVRNQNGGFMVALVLANRSGGGAAWDWVEAHWDVLLERYRGALLLRMLEGVSSLLEPEVGARARAFLAERDLPVGPQRVAQILERQSINTAFAARWRGGLAGALSRQG